jgi:hypothetical protein
VDWGVEGVGEVDQAKPDGSNPGRKYKNYEKLETDIFLWKQRCGRRGKDQQPGSLKVLVRKGIPSSSSPTGGGGGGLVGILYRVSPTLFTLSTKPCGCCTQATETGSPNSERGAGIASSNSPPGEWPDHHDFESHGPDLEGPPFVAYGPDLEGGSPRMTTKYQYQNSGRQSDKSAPKSAKNHSGGSGNRWSCSSTRTGWNRHH